MQTSFEKIMFLIDKDYTLPPSYGAPKKLESWMVSGANVVLTISFDRDVNPLPDSVQSCHLMAIRLGGKTVSPYNRIVKIVPTVLLTGDCFGEVN